MSGQGARVEALGVAGAPAPNQLTTTFRFQGGVVLDTGAAVHGIPVDRRAGIEFVLLSHAHLDHTLGLPFLLAETKLTVIGLAATLDAVRSGLLNGQLWPDLCHQAEWSTIGEGSRFDAGGWQFEAGPARHTVPCLSYAATRDARTIVVAGDTRLDQETIAWARDRGPSACIVEVSFPDRFHGLARRYGHQTPRDLKKWRAGLGDACHLHVTHMKPGHEEAIRAECEGLKDPNIHILHDGDILFV